MDYSTLILGKPLRDLNYSDIEHFFMTPKEETDLIEFKSYNPKAGLNDAYEGVIKAVCALGNSDGGLIVWGAPVGEKVSGKKEKVYSGSLTNIDQTIEKDTLVSKISSKLVPILSDFNCQILTEGTGKVCIIEVQKSNYAPHQFDNIYYMRLDGQSTPAPHHYIEALFKQIRYPNIEGYLRLKNMSYRINPLEGDGITVELTIYIINRSAIQNEEYLYWRLESNFAKFYTEDSPRANSNTVSNNDVTIVFPYGKEYKINLVCFLSTADLLKNKRKLLLSLYFGGRFSPMKKSEYRISVPSEFDNSGTNSYNDTYEKISENILVYDSDVEIGIPFKDRLRMLLGR